MRLKEIIEKTDRIKGWFLADEMKALYPIVKNLPKDGLLVEIGTYCGRSTMFFSLTNPEIKILTIDALIPTDGKIEGYSKHTPEKTRIWPNVLEQGNIFQVIGKSKDVMEGFNWEIDFLFIDGAHDYWSVYQDITCWTPFIKLGGFIAFHDFKYIYLRQCVNRWLKDNKEFVKLDRSIDNLLIVKYENKRKQEAVS